jgi:hypothetical protein
MNGSRRVAATALLVATLVGGCAQPPRPATTAPPPATATPLVGGDRLVHGYRFPDGERLAPPTGRPRLGWRQAFYVSQRDIGTRELDGLRVDLLMGPFVNPRAPVRVTLADYRRAGLARPLLAWVVVYRNDQAVRFGPTPAEVRGGRDRMLWRWPRCPVYAVVDAISGRYLEEFSACQPPYRG